MIRHCLFAACLAACGARIGSRDVEVVDTARVQTAASFAAFSQQGVSAAFSRQGVDPTHIDSARLTAFTMTSQTSNKDLSFFEKGTMFIQTSAADRTQIASTQSFPAGSFSVEFSVASDVELKPFITAASYQIVLELPFARPPPLNGVEVEAKAVIHADLKL